MNLRQGLPMLNETTPLRHSRIMMTASRSHRPGNHRSGPNGKEQSERNLLNSNAWAHGSSSTNPTMRFRLQINSSFPKSVIETGPLPSTRPDWWPKGTHNESTTRIRLCGHPFPGGPTRDDPHDLGNCPHKKTHYTSIGCERSISKMVYSKKQYT